MSTYYDQLNLSPAADQAQITAAIDTRYNGWRQLVTHPQYGTEAQQQIQLLETMRDTLTDPVKRAAYDGAMGVGGVVNGLFDPSRLPQSAPPSPRQPAPPASVPQPSGWICSNCGSPNNATGNFCSKCGSPRSPTAPHPALATTARSLWACPKCQTENPPLMPYCCYCNAQIARTCPECNKQTSLIATGICGSCGYTYDIATQRSTLRAELSDLQKNKSKLQEEHKKAFEINNAKNSSFGCSFLLLSIIAYPVGMVVIPILTNTLVYSLVPSISFKELPFLEQRASGIMGVLLAAGIMIGIAILRQILHFIHAAYLESKMRSIDRRIHKTQQQLYSITRPR